MDGARAAVRTPAARRAAELVARYGGRYSLELGIWLEEGDAQVERWFLAATLFGTRISARIAGRAFGELDRAGIHRVADAGDRSWDELVALLDAGGYARYDFRTATRLQELARVLDGSYGGQAAAIGRTFREPGALTAALDALPGWGPVTVGLFLREVRGIWPGARPPLDARAERAAHHLGLLPARAADPLAALGRLARAAGCDRRDLEAALVRLSLDRHHRPDCPGGARCTALGPREPGARHPQPARGSPAHRGAGHSELVAQLP